MAHFGKYFYCWIFLVVFLEDPVLAGFIDLGENIRENKGDQVIMVYRKLLKSKRKNGKR